MLSALLNDSFPSIPCYWFLYPLSIKFTNSSIVGGILVHRRVPVFKSLLRVMKLERINQSINQSITKIG